MSPGAGSGSNAFGASTRPPFAIVEKGFDRLRLSMLTPHLRGDRSMLALGQGTVVRLITRKVFVRVFCEGPVNDLGLGDVKQLRKALERLACDAARRVFRTGSEEYRVLCH